MDQFRSEVYAEFKYAIKFAIKGAEKDLDKKNIQGSQKFHLKITNIGEML